MQSFDSALFEMYSAGTISMKQALKNADSANNLKVRIAQTTGVQGNISSGLSIEEDNKEEKEEMPNIEEVLMVKKSGPDEDLLKFSNE